MSERATSTGRPRVGRPPSVERVLAAARGALGEREHDAVLAGARAIVADERERLARDEAPRTAAELGAELVTRLDGFARSRGSGPASVINATGVIVHTNLGRAPWPLAAIDAARAAAAEPLLLEIDRATGRRSSRYRMAEDHLVALTGAEDALVTNNNAAALALAVGLAGRGGGVVVSRGELVEIGGGVRIPEIVRRAGARLIEVGTTNRTRAADYREPFEEGRARLILRVHPSNFRQDGFVEAPEPFELAELAHRHGALVVDDLGSGALLDTAAFGLAHEPTPSERLAAGADVVTFSGDKLVGGAQAGLIVGRAEPIARLRRDPLARATRPDKTTLAAVAATLGLYRAGLAVREIPVWRMIAARTEDLRARAEALVARLDDPVAGERPVALASTVGGGSLPGETLPSWGIAIPGSNTLLARLRAGEPPVIARIEDGRVVLDLRTVDPAHDTALARAIAAALGAASGR
jgi:L-seryl-tRNA(Ser) seleniumtransferase